MRIVQVHPYKERTVRVLVQPRHGVRYDYAPTALRRMVTISSRRHYAEAGVVGVKPPVKAGNAPRHWVENQRTDKSCGVISVRVQDCGCIRQGGRQRHAEVVHLVKLGVRPRQDGRVRGRGQRDLRICPCENHRLAGQRIEVRRQSTLGTQEPHTVGARCIHCDQHNVGRPNPRRERARHQPCNTHPTDSR